jgi:hypothetical protein
MENSPVDVQAELQIGLARAYVCVHVVLSGG